MPDTKETKEVLVAVNEVALYLLGLLKDGVDLSDGVALAAKLAGDEKFRTLLQEAVKGSALIKDEVKDLSLPESLELVMLELSYVPKFLSALKAQ